MLFAFIKTCIRLNFDIKKKKKIRRFGIRIQKALLKIKTGHENNHGGKIIVKTWRLWIISIRWYGNSAYTVILLDGHVVTAITEGEERICYLNLRA